MKYWAYVNNEILGPFEKEKLLELPSFSPSLLVCPQTPVGEKTEDWKDAAAYPELAALLPAGNKPPAAAAPAPAPATERIMKPAVSERTPAPAALKPLTSSPVEPVAPADHKFMGVDITVNHLGKAQAAAPGLEPISLSQAGSGAGNPEAQAPFVQKPAEKINYGPAQQENPKASLELPGFNQPRAQEYPSQPPSFTPGAAPELETFARPASYAAPAARTQVQTGSAATQPIDSVTRQDLSQAIDPLRLKLDQMAEVIASIKNQQFQRDVMDKLAYLENAIGEMKSSGKQTPVATPQVSIAPAQVKETSARTIFGVQPQAREEASPEKPPVKPGKIVDTGSRKSDLGAIVKRSTRLLATIGLLAAVLLVAVVVLKNLGVFDATALLPFQLPFSQKAPPPPAPAQVPQPEPAPVQQAQAPKPEEPPKTPDLSPEIIYFTRTYKAVPSGPTLEDKISENSAAAGGDYNNVNWQVKPGDEGIFEIAAQVPAKTGPLTYGYIVNYGKKTLLPADELGKAVFASLTPKPRAKGRTAGRTKKAAAAPAPRQKPQPRKAAPPKQTAPEDEYEYVYEEDDGTGK